MAVAILAWTLLPSGRILRSGELAPVSSGDCRGSVELVQNPQGLVVRLRDLRGCGDQPVQVLLLASTNARDDETVESTLRVMAGTMSPTNGSANIPLPDVANLDRYRALTIWDAALRMNLATAALR